MEITSLEKLIPLLFQHRVKRFVKGDLSIDFGGDEEDQEKPKLKGLQSWLPDEFVQKEVDRVKEAIQAPLAPSAAVGADSPLIPGELMQFEKVLHWSDPSYNDPSTGEVPLPLTGESASQLSNQASQ